MSSEENVDKLRDRHSAQSEHFARTYGRPRTLADKIFQNNVVPPKDYPKIAVGVMVYRQGRVLLGERVSDTHQGGKYSFPGGHVEMFESLEVAARRELREECGTAMLTGAFEFVDIIDTQYPSEGKHYFVAMFRTPWLQGLPWNEEPEKCRGWSWYHWNSMPQPLIQGVRKLYDEYGEALVK
jgi:8-oxo-dGTP diphosphatase